jgi:plasmid stabilization system protein ParE
MVTLVFSPNAKQDLKDIQKYIREEPERPQTALNVVSKILDKAETLIQFPESGTPLASRVGFETNFRFLISGGYLIFYEYEKHRVFVDRIIHSRRDYLKILFPGLPEE